VRHGDPFVRAAVWLALHGMAWHKGLPSRFFGFEGCGLRRRRGGERIAV
jgi:hypothetical protein